MALKKCEVLSGGEKARVLLGKLIATPVHCLLLDEPSNHLDMQSVDSLVEALDVFDGAVVMVTHNEMILNNIANKLIVFDGEFPYLYLGTYQEFLADRGFSDEEKIIQPKKEKKDSNKQQKLENRKTAPRTRKSRSKSRRVYRTKRIFRDGFADGDDQKCQRRSKNVRAGKRAQIRAVGYRKTIRRAR